MHRLFRRELLICVALLTAACSDNQTPVTPTPILPATITDTFVGTVGPTQLAHTHTFAVASGGTVTATLVTLTPDSTLVVGLAIGTWNGTTCQQVLANDQATQGSTVTGTLSAAGNLCVRIYAVGDIPNVETYQINALHP
jgi:hypothetical protein